MVKQTNDMCTIRVHCPNARAVWLAREISRWLPMRKVERGSWEISFRLPRGRERFRSYVKDDRSIRLHEVYELDSRATK